MKNDECELCGCVDTRLNAGLCAACEAKCLAPALTSERLLAVMTRHIGSRNGASIAHLANEMLSHRHIELRERAGIERNIREIVVQLRLAGHHICSHPSTGYFIAATPEELDAACSFLYDRAMTSLSQVAAMKRVSLPDLRGQLHLPT